MLGTPSMSLRVGTQLIYIHIYICICICIYADVHNSGGGHRMTGEAGVTKCLDLLVNELVTTMMLMGTPTVAEVDETALDASRLHPPTAASVNSSESASKL